MSSFSIVILILGMILLAIAAICAVFASRGEGRLGALLDTPTSTTQAVYQRYRHDGGAFGQPCEVVGLVESDTSLTGPVSGQLCVIYSSTVAWEEWEQTSMLNQRGADMSGMVQTGGSSEIDDRHVSSFWVRDATGRLLVDPLMADADLLEIDQKYEVISSSIGQSERRAWRTEKALPLGQQVYVLGYMGEQNGEPVLRRHPSDPNKKIIISYRSKQDLARATSGRTNLLYLSAGICGGAGVLMIVWQLLRR